MKIFPSTLVALFALGSWTIAEVPKRAPSDQYASLWTDSPFTSKPPPEKRPVAPNPLDDYVLAGISPITGGYRVTMLNRKNPEQRITVDSSQAEDYQILAVTREAGEPLRTTVRISMGAVTGTVTFDENLLVLKAPPPQIPQETRSLDQRQPRPRVAPQPDGQQSQRLNRNRR